MGVPLTANCISMSWLFSASSGFMGPAWLVRDMVDVFDVIVRFGVWVAVEVEGR